MRRGYRAIYERRNGRLPCPPDFTLGAGRESLYAAGMLSKLASLAIACTAAIAACGGATPESTTPPPAGSQAPAASASTAQTAQPAQDPDAKLEAQRDVFIDKCTSKGPSVTKEYCTCAFEQFKAVFKGVDLDKTEPTKEQYELVKTKTVAACAGMLSEATIKTSFVTSCSSSDARMSGYCECAWTSLRKTLSLGDFATDLAGPRFDDAKKRMVDECKGKMPEAVVKSIFVEACTKQSGDAKACECMWKKVRAKYSAAEIAGGVADVKSVPVAECKKK